MRKIVEAVIALGLMILGIAFSSNSMANIPKQISIQGEVTDSNGDPLGDGSYAFTFSIYTQANGGSALYTESSSSFAVKNGVFQYYLGTNNSLNLPFGTEYWVGISVGGGSEMTPRQKIVSVGNAYKALNSDTANYALTALNASTATYLTDAGDILGGNLADTRLSTNIPRLNTSNIWTGTQRFNGKVGVNMANNGQSWLQIAADGCGQGSLEQGQIMAMSVSSVRKRLIMGYDSSNDCGYINAGRSLEAWTNLNLQNAGGNVGIFTYNTAPTERLEIGTGNVKLRAGNILMNTGYTVDGVDVSQNNATYLGNETTQVLTAATYYDCVTSVTYRSGGVTVNWSAPFTQPPSITSDVFVSSYNQYVSYDIQWTNVTSTSGTFRVNWQCASSGVCGEASTDVKVMIHTIGK
jgi:hypothetical protein